MVPDYLVFSLFPTFAPLPRGQKITSLSKIYILTWKSSLSEVNFSTIWINTIVCLLMDTVADSPVLFLIINNIISSNLSHRVVVPFLFLYINNHNVKQGI